MKNNDKEHTVAVRLDPALVAKLDAHVERMRRAAPGARMTRSDAMRQLLMEAVEARAKSEQIHFAA